VLLIHAQIRQRANYRFWLAFFETSMWHSNTIG
jgi:hypothetical protein